MVYLVYMKCIYSLGYNEENSKVNNEPPTQSESTRKERIYVTLGSIFSGFVTVPARFYVVINMGKTHSIHSHVV